MSTDKDIFDDDFEVIYQEDHYSALLRDAFERDSDGDYDNYDGDDHDDDYGGDSDDYDDSDYDYDYDYDYDDDYDYDYDDYDYDYDYDDDDYDDYDYDYDDDYNRRSRGSSRSSYDSSDKRKRRRISGPAAPAAKTARTGVKLLCKLVSLLLRGASLILTAIIIYILAADFWKNHSAYGDIFHAFTERNYTLAAYAAVAGFLLLFELIAFLLILFTSRKNDRRSGRYDTGRGLFSFVFIYVGAYLSSNLYELVPAAPAPLEGVQGALLVYGTLHSALLPLCAAGIISCLIRRFIIR